MSVPPRYLRCGPCGSWLKIGLDGVYRHPRGDGARCNQLLASKIFTAAKHGRVLASPLLASGKNEGQLCLFCQEPIGDSPSGLCNGCLIIEAGAE